jgi:hypothetical protein
MVTDHAMRKWPDPTFIPPTDRDWFMELIRKAEEYDKIHKQPNCIQVEKFDWLKAARDAEQKEKQDLLKYIKPCEQLGLF